MKIYKLLTAFLPVYCSLIMSTSSFANQAISSDFNVVGSMGFMKFVIISTEKQRDIDFHRKIVKQICSQGETCFLNFFTNSKNAPEILPLDDRILAEPTLMYKYSPKHRNEIEDWSCRLKLPIKSCF